MELIFFRHGDAEDVGPDGSDFTRRMTARGQAETEAVARAFLRCGWTPDRLICSPLTRAVQTAEVIARAMGATDQPIVDQRLASGATLRDVEKVVAETGGARLLLVGHEPDLSQIVSGLIGGARVAMKKSAAALVEAERVRPGTGELQWLIRPDTVGEF